MNQSPMNNISPMGAPIASSPIAPTSTAHHSKLYLWIVVAVGFVALAGLWWYYRQSQIETNALWQQIQMTIQPSEDPQTAALKQQSSSDDIDSISADLQATDFNNIDKEGGAIIEALNR